MKLKSGKIEEAAASVQRGLVSGKQADEWRALAAAIEFRRRHYETCLHHLQALTPHPDRACSTPLAELGQLAVDQGIAAVAEAAFVAAFNAHPGESTVSISLGYLLGVEGRCWEAAPYHIAAIRNQRFTLHHLILLGASDPVIEDPAMVARFIKSVPADPLPRLGEARTAMRKQEFLLAEEILRLIVAVDPHCGEAQGQLGRLLEPGDPERFRAWNAQVSERAEFHPEVWVARGLFARQQGQLSGAARCLWEATQRDPNHRVAHFQLGQVLMALNRSEEAQSFLLRAKLLQELAELVDQIFQHPTEVVSMQRAVDLTEELGRPIEAWAWAISALQIDQSHRRAQEAVERLQRPAMSATSQFNTDAQLARRYDLSNLALPDLSPSTVPPSNDRRVLETARASIHFDDEGLASGINFTYRSRGPEVSGDMRMYETTGGGVAVLDYDGDHYPDLYFTQGGSVTPDKQPKDWIDRCYRNVGGAGWEDISAVAGLNDLDYGQGVTAGDFDNDGFADLYVANLGRNRLYHNQGDGTFLDVTDTAGLTTQRWSTSCLIADLNGDGWPDLYDVNYLSREDAIRSTCHTGNELRWCSPDTFAAEQDQLFLSLGDGRFRDVTTVSGIERPLGKGMGIIAADFDGSSRLSLFIANDAVPNFFFENQTQPAGAEPTFTESALQKGLALDADGLPQACMGVAAGDVNGDQLFDLFITNFYEQSNTLYLQRPGVMFEDATRRAGLREPSWKFLGFGTQCLDADLDGWLDLVVTNGHVLDLSAKGVPFRMRPQFFHNARHGQFLELSESSLGSYFQREQLGRGLSRLDWNRDGLPDFAVSNIGSSASLVTNRSKDVGNFLAIRLVAVHSARDAIGAEVILHAGDRVWSQQLVSGDGYQCRNESRIVFGLGSTDSIDHWSIRWPSGTVTKYGGITTNVEVLATENNPPLTMTRD